MNIRLRLIVTFSFVVILFLSIVSVISYYYIKGTIIDNMEKVVLSSLDENNAKINGWLREKGKIVETTSNILSVLQNNEEVTPDFFSFYKNDKDLINLYVGYESKKLINGAMVELPPNYDPTVRGWYQDAKKSDSIIFSDAYIDAGTNQFVISPSIALRNTKGDFIGVVGCDILLTKLIDIASEIRILEGAGTGLLVDKSGIILAHHDSRFVSKNFTEIEGFNDIGKKIMDSKKGKVEYNLNKIDKICYYNVIPSTGWILAIAIEKKVIFKELILLRYFFILVVLFSIAATVLLCVFISGKISKPILSVVNYGIDISKGDFSNNLPDTLTSRKDEIGKLSSVFNQFILSMRNMVNDISFSGNKIDSSVMLLSDAMSKVSDKSNTQSKEVENLKKMIYDLQSEMKESMDVVKIQSDNMNNISSVIEDISKALRELSTKASFTKNLSNETSSRAKDGENTVESALLSMRNIDKVVNNIEKKTTILGKSTEEIGKIIWEIKKITSQTNLLALNASIEAAHVGERGQGFAVVADEIKELADRSNNATKDIDALIKGIKEEVKDVLFAVNEGYEQVKEGIILSEEAKQKLSEIIIKVEDTDREVQFVSHLMDDKTTLMEEIAGTVKGAALETGSLEKLSNIQIVTLNDIVDELEKISLSEKDTSLKTNEVKSDAENLTNISRELRELIKHYKV